MWTRRSLMIINSPLRRRRLRVYVGQHRVVAPLTEYITHIHVSSVFWCYWIPFILHSGGYKILLSFLYTSNGFHRKNTVQIIHTRKGRVLVTTLCTTQFSSVIIHIKCGICKESHGSWQKFVRSVSHMKREDSQLTRRKQNITKNTDFCVDVMYINKEKWNVKNWKGNTDQVVQSNVNMKWCFSPH